MKFFFLCGYLIIRYQNWCLFKDRKVLTVCFKSKITNLKKNKRRCLQSSIIFRVLVTQATLRMFRHLTSNDLDKQHSRWSLWCCYLFFGVVLRCFQPWNSSGNRCSLSGALNVLFQNNSSSSFYLAVSLGARLFLDSKHMFDNRVHRIGQKNWDLYGSRTRNPIFLSLSNIHFLRPVVFCCLVQSTKSIQTRKTVHPTSWYQTWRHSSNNTAEPKNLV